MPTTHIPETALPEIPAGREPRVHEVVTVHGVGAGRPRFGSRQLSDFRPISLGGLVATTSGTHDVTMGSEPTALTKQTLADAVLWTGEWFGAFESSDKQALVICSDFFGYCPVTWALHSSAGTEGTLHASSSLRGIATSLARAGHDSRVAWPTAIPSLVSNATIFMQRSSPRSLREGAQTLRPDQFLLVTAEGVELIDRPFFADPQGRSFDELVAAGTERAAASLRAAMDDGHGSFNLSLSGGKDSRGVLALALAAGVQDRLEVYSADPRTAAPASRPVIARDLPLAATMVARYGLTWKGNDPVPQRRVTFEETLDLFQDYRGGQSYEFRAPFMLGEPSGPTMLSLHGGGGELYRSHYGHLHRDAYPRWAEGNANSTDGIRSDLTRLFNTLVPAAAVPTQLYRQTRTAFVDALDYGLASDVDGTLDRFYAMHRNRAHFGMVRYGVATGNTILCPLAQPEFLWANGLLSREDQETGRLLFALLEQGDPDLNALPFEAHPWPEEWVAQSKGRAEVWTDELRESGLASWREKDAQNRAVPADQRPAVIGTETFDALDESRRAIAERMDELLTHPATTEAARQLASTIAATQENSRASTISMAARVASLTDALGTVEHPVVRRSLAFDSAGLRKGTVPTAPVVRERIVVPTAAEVVAALPRPVQKVGYLANLRSADTRRAVAQARDAKSLRKALVGDRPLPRHAAETDEQPEYAEIHRRSTVGDLNLEVRVEDGRLHALASTDGPVEYAYYVFHGDERVETRWYETDAELVYPAEGALEPGTWKVRVHARRPGITTGGKVMNSEPLIVD